ncbi:MetQ/NlpA family ABC transporter substrate-binding protein [Gorillibacterium massiliense]|uniref:MetQ/NlpA family ABC transporter substrate-binding protein n=1 Tax=Gorillibacterium massiliense TaxID=1280390 RepID=UPI0004B9ED37|nr:MetQ/NlpA family ABC transporter substrate-binding protein [Gorillibacterium massiliense]
MKKWITLLFTVVLAFSLAACGSKSDNKSGSEASTTPESSTSAAPTTAPSAEPVKITVGATTPHAEILEHLKPALEKEGVILDIKEFTDYVQPNVQLNDKQLDANYFQHVPYLDEFNKEHNMNLVKVVGVHVEPMGIYSKKIKSLDELKDKAKVTIPNDATNGGRALLLLEKAGLLKLKDGVGINATVKDIVDNPKKLAITELEAAMLPRTLDEVAISVVNTNFALDAGLKPTKDALFIEDKDSPYVNILVAREDNKDSDAIQKLAKALNSEDTRKFIETQYEGALVPAF